MKIYQVSEKKYAIGEPGKRARYVVEAVNNHGRYTISGVRGVKPKLDDRYKVVTPNAQIVTALNEAVA